MSIPIQYIRLFDRSDRLGSNLIWYVSTILVAIKHKYKIQLIKPKSEYSYCTSIFVQALFDFIDEYNTTCFENKPIERDDVLIHEPDHFCYKVIGNVLKIQCDYVSAFKEHVFTLKFIHNLNRLAKHRNYNIPYDPQKTIVVHLRLDDRAHHMPDKGLRTRCSQEYQKIINDDDINFKFPGVVGQSAMKEETIKEIIESTLLVYKGYEVVIITNGQHTLPYRTIHSTDESHDLFLLCNSKVLIGSMSTYSFAAIMFGQHESVYYPLWEHAVCFGLTTKYDKTNTITFF